MVTTRSAAATCRAASGYRSSAASPVVAATHAVMPASSMRSASAGSATRSDSIGVGSASPLVSTRMREKGAHAPAARRATRSPRVRARSPRTAQQRQPPASSTTESSADSTSRWSMPIAPSSLTTTAVSRSPSARSRRLRSVVLPLPRNPVRTKTGVRPSPSSVPRRRAAVRASGPPAPAPASPSSGGGALIRSLAGAKSGSRANRTSRSTSSTEARGSPSRVQAVRPSSVRRRGSTRRRPPPPPRRTSTAPSPVRSARAATFHWANDASRRDARSGDRGFVPSGMDGFGAARAGWGGGRARYRVMAGEARGAPRQIRSGLKSTALA